MNPNLTKLIYNVFVLTVVRKALVYIPIWEAFV